jgi:diaminohydroxyphosphoribosylaminopyrimidine deaminase/5-amino-6-(5-phosphoribosylamino)uracil reductase
MISPCVDPRQDDEEWQVLLAAARGTAPPPPVRGKGLARIYSPLVIPLHGPDSLLVGQMGQSLDGRIATASGHSHYINGTAALIHLHRLRALADAVVIGVGTAVADDPQLTVRRVRGPNPARVVIDPGGRLPSTARCLAEDGARRIVIQSDERARPAGVEVVRLAAPNGRVAPDLIREALAALGLRRILIEGGGMTISQFLNAGCLDRLHVIVGPMILGSGRVGISLPEIATLDDAMRPVVTVTEFPDGDVLFDCDLRSRTAAAQRMGVP